MRLSIPRIPPLPQDQIPEEIMKYTGTSPGQHVYNVYATIARHAKLCKRWLVFGAHVMTKNTMAHREREMVILRIGWRCNSEYEWGQHARLGKAFGLTDEEIKRIAKGPDAPGWNSFDAALLRAADELHDDQFITDATWNALGARYSHEQLLDLIFTVGNYTMVSMALNTLGVQLDEGTPTFAETT